MNQPIQIARWLIGLSWIYHGIFPKLLQVAPLEKAMTATIGLSSDHSWLLTKAAGVGEVIFGVVLIIWYQNRALIWLSILGLCGLLMFVMVMMPVVLLEAFNPVTTNLPLIGLSLILLNQLKAEQNTQTETSGTS